MINSPDILFGDELTGSLNSSATGDILHILDGINGTGTTVLLVTHDKNVAVHAEKVILLEDGKRADTIILGKYEEGDCRSRTVEIEGWLKKLGF